VQSTARARAARSLTLTLDVERCQVKKIVRQAYSGRVIALLALMFSLSTACVQAEIRPMLVDSWLHEESGVVLSILGNGKYSISKADSAVVQGELEVACWEQANWHPANYVDVFILRLELEGQWWLFSGSFIAGEGDPCGLWLHSGLIAPKPFFNAFGVSDEVYDLKFRGSGP
jgi:hypothetical protein